MSQPPVCFSPVQKFPGGEVHHAPARALLHHRGHQQVFSQEELVVQLPDVGVLLIVEHQGTQGRQARLLALAEQIVIIGQEGIAELHILAEDVRDLRAEAPGFLHAGVPGAVAAEQRGEAPHLHPTGHELRGAVRPKAADVRAVEGHAAQTETALLGNAHPQMPP